jgi:D-threo-aldose 1-dehydrogenase
VEAVCRRWGVPLKAAAVQFPFGHPAVASVVVGCRTAADIQEVEALCRLPIPPGLWRDLVAEGLLPEEGIPQP